MKISQPRVHTGGHLGLTDSASTSARRIRPEVKAKIYQLVGAGLTKAVDVRDRVRHFVETELSVDGVPAKGDVAFFPKLSSVRNHINSAIAAGYLNKGCDPNDTGHCDPSNTGHCDPINTGHHNPDHDYLAALTSSLQDDLAALTSDLQENGTDDDEEEEQRWTNHLIS